MTTHTPLPAPRGGSFLTFSFFLPLFMAIRIYPTHYQPELSFTGRGGPGPVCPRPVAGAAARSTTALRYRS